MKNKIEDSKQENIQYTEQRASAMLEDYIELYWEYKNESNSPKDFIIIPDSFFKIIIEIQDGKVKAFFMTGIWTKERKVIIPPYTVAFGIKLKILAPEYLLTQTISELLDSKRNLAKTYLDFDKIDYSSFQSTTEQVENIFISLLANKQIDSRKILLSRSIYTTNGNIEAKKISEQIFWSNRQINRYLNKQIGISLKKYLNIQRCYTSYIQIREGRFFPDKAYYDQAHFIKEVKKYTSHTPKELYEEQNDRFIQLKHIKK